MYELTAVVTAHRRPVQAPTRTHTHTTTTTTTTAAAATTTNSSSMVEGSVHEVPSLVEQLISAGRGRANFP